jgi:hypothetical protein
MFAQLKPLLRFSASDSGVVIMGGTSVTIVLQSDAKAAILADFGRWAEERLAVSGTTVDSRVFYSHLNANKRHLLEFRHPNPDKCQVVHSWLSGAGLVKD